MAQLNREPTVQRTNFSPPVAKRINDPKYQPFINLGEKPKIRYPGEMSRPGSEFIQEELGKVKNGK